MASLSQSLVFTRDHQFPSFPGSPFKHVEQSPVNCSPTYLSLHPIRQGKAKLSTRGSSVIVQAAYSGDGGRSAGIFVGGFVLGGIVVGALGCIYAPQISKALAGADRKDLMRKLPKFIYDEEKALERTRKILTEKIAQLNSAIDDVSSQLRANDVSNGAAVVTDEVETAI